MFRGQILWNISGRTRQRRFAIRHITCTIPGIANTLRHLRNAFITGVVLLLPIGVTIIVVKFLVDNIGVPATDWVFFFLEKEILDSKYTGTALNVVSLLVVLVLITVMGFFSRYVAGKLFLTWIERIVDYLPGVNTLYRTVKQIVDTFSMQEKAVFQKAVLVEYPRKGVWVLGFLTSETRGETQDKTMSELQNIFVPTTPNPTSGFLLMVPKEECIDLEMTIGDAMKLIISGGAVTPVPKTSPPIKSDGPELHATKPPAAELPAPR